MAVSIIVCSTSRYARWKRGKKVDDQSGDMIESLLSSAGHRIIGRVLIPDSRRDLTHEIRKATGSATVDSVIVCGGTGITKQDVTIEVIERLLDKEIPGFGEIFRKLSHDRIGSAAVLSRALAGVIKSKAIFCLPGSTDAVRLAMNELILPEICHIVKHASE